LRKEIFILILAIQLVQACEPKKQKVKEEQFVFNQNFDQTPNGNLSVASIKKDWDSPQFLWGLKDRFLFYLGIKGSTPEIIGDVNKQLLVRIPSKTVGPIAGSQWSTKFENSYNELLFQFDVKFDSNFCFVKGGKLPGLAGGKANTGGKKPNGMDGWSARMMFWEEGKLCFWIYHKNQPGEFGDSLFFKKNNNYFKFQRGIWYTIKHHIYLNKPGKKNGLIEGYINDTLWACRNNIEFRSIEGLKIDQLIFSVFMGGDEPIYQSEKEERIYFDNFLVTKFHDN